MMAGRGIENSLYEKVVKEHGTQLTTMPDDAKKPFRDSVQKLYDEVGKRVGMEKELKMVLDTK